MFLVILGFKNMDFPFLGVNVWVQCERLVQFGYSTRHLKLVKNPISGSLGP